MWSSRLWIAALLTPLLSLSLSGADQRANERECLQMDAHSSVVLYRELRTTTPNMKVKLSVFALAPWKSHRSERTEAKVSLGLTSGLG